MNWAEFFDRCAEFFKMDGYAFYVWGSFGVALLSMGVEVLLLRRRKRLLLRQAKQAHKMNSWKEHESTT